MSSLEAHGVTYRPHYVTRSQIDHLVSCFRESRKTIFALTMAFGSFAFIFEIPVEAVHHLELSSQLLLGQMVQHPSVHQRLHEVTAVLGQTEAGQPLVAHPLVIHVAVGQDLEATNR